MTTIEKRPKRSNTISQRKPVIPPRRKSRGLPRPKTQPTYNIPIATTNIPSPHQPSDSDTPTARLSKIKLLLDLIVRRNKNQHRTQHFWKWLCLLRRAIAHLLTLQQQSDKASTTAPAATINADTIRRTFETQAEIRSQREVHDDWVREVLVPGCYVAFSAIVADKQFANLGVVLMGVLGDVVGAVGVMRKVESVASAIVARSSLRSMRPKVTGNQGGSITALSTMVTGPDQGEVVERQYESDGPDAMIAIQTEDLSTRHDEGVVIERKQPGPSTRLIDSATDLPNSDRLDDDRMGLSSSTPDHENDVNTLKTPSVTKTSMPKPTTQSTHRLTAKRASQPKTQERRHALSTLDHPSTASPAGNCPITTSKAKSSKSRALSSTATTSSVNASDTKVKKKKKKGNAIDDLFGGFA